MAREAWSARAVRPGGHGTGSLVSTCCEARWSWHGKLGQYVL